MTQREKNPVNTIFIIRSRKVGFSTKENITNYALHKHAVHQVIPSLLSGLVLLLRLRLCMSGNLRLSESSFQNFTSTLEFLLSLYIFQSIDCH